MCIHIWGFPYYSSLFIPIPRLRTQHVNKWPYPRIRSAYIIIIPAMEPCNTICMYLYLYVIMLVIVLSLPSLSSLFHLPSVYCWCTINRVLLTAKLLHNITIEVQRNNHVTKCNYFGPVLGAAESRRLPCPPETYGQIVVVKKAQTDNTMLILCEVEVYGPYGTYNYIIITRIVNSRELYKTEKRAFVLVVVLLRVRACVLMYTRTRVYCSV